MNPKIMKRPIFRMGGSARPGYRDSNFADLIKNKEGLRQSILKDIGSIRDARSERLSGMKSIIPLSLLAQQEGIGQIRKPMDIVNLLSALGTDPRTFGALAKLDDIKLEDKKGELSDKLAALKVMDSKSKKFEFEKRLDRAKEVRQTIADFVKKEKAVGRTDDEIRESATFKSLNQDLDLLLRETSLKSYLFQRSAKEGEDFDIKQATKDYYSILKKQQIFQSGGRVGFQEGTPNPEFTMPQPKPQEAVQDRQLDTLMKAAPALEDPNQAKSMGEGDMYAALRRRLPQEITDDVVRLIAYNPEAFADFADIQDQSDVDSFNQKYNVQLVLPVENVT